MTIYIIWFYDSYGNRDLVAITNEPLKWLEENNKQRVDAEKNRKNRWTWKHMERIFIVNSRLQQYNRQYTKL